LTTGRFGWKAEQPTVEEQTAAAFLADMGLTTPMFAKANHTAAQAICDREPNGGDPEVSPAIFKAVVFYARTLAVPARRHLDDPSVIRGEKLFRQLGCAACHVPEWQTGSSAQVPELAGQVIYPYTDLLLHDLGDELADGRPVNDASGSEWR